MSDAATVFAIYRFRPDVTDATIADLLSRHRDVLQKSGLVTETLPKVVRSTQNNAEHRDFIEIFEWKDPAAPGAAHSDPAVRQIWQEFEGLTSMPAVSLNQLAEAAHPFAHFAPFAVTYQSQKATIRPKKKAKAATKPAAKASKAPKTVKNAGKSRRPASRGAPKARGRRRTAARR
jgi:hypothetical protein